METAPHTRVEPGCKLRVGVDLGTAYLLLVVLDEFDVPLAGEGQFAQVVQIYTGIATHVPRYPLFITPLGMALQDPAQV